MATPDGEGPPVTARTEEEPDAATSETPDEYFYETVEPSPEYQLISTLLEDSEARPAAIAEALALLGEEAVANNSFDLQTVHNAIVYKAERVAFASHGKLAAAVIEYQRLTEGAGSPAETRRRELVTQTDWAELRYFIVDMVHAWGGEHDTYETRPAEGQRWEHFFAFLAQLTGTSFDIAGPYTAVDNCTFSADCTGLSWFCFNYAFGRPDNPDYWEVNAFEHAVRCACWWLIRASNQLWFNVKTERKLPGTAKRQMPTWHFGFWRHWKQRAGRALLDQRYSEDTKRLLKEAIAEMDRFDVEDVVPE